MVELREFADTERPAMAGVKSAHVMAVGLITMAAALFLANVDIVEFAIYMGLTALVLAVLGDVYQRLGRFDLFRFGRR